MALSDSQTYELFAQLIALLAGTYFLLFVWRRLRSLQPGLAIGTAIVTAFVVRVLAAYGLDQTPVADELRGGDEVTFLGHAQASSVGSLGSGSFDALTSEFHVFFFSLTFRLLDQAPEMMLRIEVIALAVAGLALLSAAVYELAGPKPALIVAWVLALEPTNVFFSGLLHKEPFILLAEGLVTFGGAVLWKRGDFRALVPLVLGCLIATATRPYVGWFLAAAAAAVTLHAGLRRNSASGSFALATVVTALIIAFIPTVWNASSEENLAGLQASQDANAADEKANLSLEQVDYSTREQVVVNLPERVVDMVTRPYPWELENTSQQLGLLGTMVLFVGLIMLASALVRNGSTIMRRAGPLVYPALFLLAAYALSAGNAGTAFRYRTHLVAFLLALIVVLRQQRSEEQAAAAVPSTGRLRPVLAPGQTL
jgi:hypothetical protein